MLFQPHSNCFHYLLCSCVCVYVNSILHSHQFSNYNLLLLLLMLCCCVFVILKFKIHILRYTHIHTGTYINTSEYKENELDLPFYLHTIITNNTNNQFMLTHTECAVLCSVRIYLHVYSFDYKHL